MTYLKIIHGWKSYDNDKEIDIEKYKQKYNSRLAWIEWKMETVRNGKIGINYIIYIAMEGEKQ